MPWTEQDAKDYRKEYYQKNKEKIREYNAEYRKKRVVCECGCEVLKINLKGHQWSDKHKRRMCGLIIASSLFGPSENN